jgi:hypothetical protein
MTGCLQMLKMFNSTVIFPNVSFMILFLQLIKALEVAKNGRSKITGMSVLDCAIGCVSKK